ncbi:hypothetical protein [Caulobacter henricii]|uniref:17 kDa surface antigen n=1 Tax=Caulobacter henricii TaxID=69395 RepID=A0A0P0P214_9CAUL|nr:hypothetical protein [Caulobacter henricii]ALL14300.1 hypothetical protein AQ619_13620 [Caulobacter henricii]
MARKFSTVLGQVAAGLAALSMVAAATTASADSRRYDRYDRHHGHKSSKKTEAALVAGVIGLAIGAAIASSQDDQVRYGRRSYGHGYGYAPPPPPPPRYYGDYDDGYRSDCWTSREYDRRSGVVYERTVCR